MTHAYDRLLAKAKAAEAQAVAGELAGETGTPQPIGATPYFKEGWRRGNVFRRVLAGEVLACSGYASQCNKCGVVSRDSASCKCWPVGVDAERSRQDGYSMTLGLTVIDATAASKFLSLDALLATQDSGVAIVDSVTGAPIVLRRPPKRVAD